MIPAVNFRYFWDTLVNPRLGHAGHAPDAYVWGGSFSRDDINQGTDCSGAVSAELSAMVRGPGCIYQRQFFTGTFAGANPGDHGPWGGVDDTRGLVCIASPGDAPPGTAMIIAIRQMADPTDAHMICSVPTSVGGPWTTIEMGGPPDDYHLGVTAIDDEEFNQWFYLPGPIEGAPLPPPPPSAPGDTPLVAALKANGSFTGEQIRLIQGFSVVEGLNPAGNSTLGFTDAQLGGDTSLVGHVNALAQQFRDRASVAGPFPAGRSDLEQAQWIARLVGQAGLPVDWQGNPQPTDYVQQVVAAMPPLSSPPTPIPVPPPQSGEDMALVPQNEWEALKQQVDLLFHAYMDNMPSMSPLREPGEGPRGPVHWFVRSIDLNEHVQSMKELSKMGDSGTLATLNRVATMDLSRYPDRTQYDKELAQAILADANSPVSTSVSTLPPPPQPPAVANLPAVVDGPKSLGDVVKTVVDAVEQLNLADALSIQDRATLAASIKILQMKNGSTI